MIGVFNRMLNDRTLTKDNDKLPADKNRGESVQRDLRLSIGNFQRSYGCG
jgi:hypothetical protein